MSRFWRGWLTAWCWGVGGFGALLAAAGIPGGEGPAGVLLRLMDGSDVTFDPPLRFAVALMGAVTLGWSVTLAATIRAVIELGDRAAPVRRLMLTGMLAWYVIDSALSIATGFALNAVSNTVILAAFLAPMVAQRVGRPSLQASSTTTPGAVVR